jgi:predicted hotdog family 3-hydroxylacyl-ACP dehydratase
VPPTIRCAPTGGWESPAASSTPPRHGALCAAAAPAPRAGGGGARPARGFLAGLRGVEFHALRLDDVPDDLLCEANRVAGDESTALYEFIVQAGRTRLLNGRATVILQAGDGVPA